MAMLRSAVPAAAFLASFGLAAAASADFIKHWKRDISEAEMLRRAAVAEAAAALAQPTYLLCCDDRSYEAAAEQAVLGAQIQRLSEYLKATGARAAHRQ